MKYLKYYLRRYRKESILAPLFKMLEAGFDLIVPLVVAHIINRDIPLGNRALLIRDILLMLLMAVLGLVCSFTAQYFAARAAVGTGTGLRRQLLAHIESLSLRELDSIGTSTLLTRMTSDVSLVQNGCNMFLRLFLRSPFIVFGALILAFGIDWQLALIFVGLIVLLFGIVFGIMALTGPLYRKQQQQLDCVTGATRENLSGVRVIRAFGREKTQIRDFSAINGRLLEIQKKAGRIGAMLNPLTYGAVNTAIIGVLWFGGWSVEGGRVLPGDVIALIHYISQILIELVKLANLLVLLSKARAGMERIGTILDTETSMKFPEQAAPRKTNTLLEFDHVGFQYGGAGRPSVTDLSFVLNRGETLGIIGSTGSGKSTLVSLIPRLYDATDGQIRLWGQPIENLTAQQLQETVAIVPQKPVLFAGTVRSNLLWGNPDADDSRLWQALEAAQAAEFVRQKPEGLDAPVEQNGRNLSGGQKQRLTIARAILRNAEILILDDSASALDYATDGALRRALSGLKSTVITVSQRISSVRQADRILVLDDGNMAGLGSHKQLLESCPVYREICRSQYREEELQ